MTDTAINELRTLDGLDHVHWRLFDEIDRLRAEAVKEERAHLATIDERDHFHDMADKLAAAIAPDDVLGEHSSGNCPWQNALDWAPEKERAFEEQQAEVDRLRALRAAVVKLHDWDELVFGGFYCMHCSPEGSLDDPVSWPCPSLRAVGMTDEEALGIITAHRAAMAKEAGQ